MDVAPGPRAGQKDRDHYSNFLLTVNTNYRPRDDTEAEVIATKLHVASNEFLQLEPIMSAVKFVGAAAKTGTPADILRVEVTSAAIELGTDTRGQRVHLHAFIKFKHRTMMQLDGKVIQAWFNHALEDDKRIKNCYVNVRWVPASDEMVQAYIAKHQRTVRAPKPN
jgi:hypothetical protein